MHKLVGLVGAVVKVAQLDHIGRNGVTVNVDAMAQLKRVLVN